MSKVNTVDITPQPRILRTLGDIPFQTWQCFAELIDNSIDAFLSKKNDLPESSPSITVTWDSDSVGVSKRTIEIRDNATGMSIEQMRHAVSAGYSSNDPINNLGLFGMGFNIATARLGEVTTVQSTRDGDTDWACVTIDFQKLIESGTFNAPLSYRPKSNVHEHGTKITISKLRLGIASELLNKASNISRRLESIYTPLLEKYNILIYIKGNLLHPLKPCVWSGTRYVIHNNKHVAARIEIDRDLGPAYFDTIKNRYLSADESDQYYVDNLHGKKLPEFIVQRSRHLTGWLGIQRYADPNDYGIDFIRNGRKILVSDKTLFFFEQPQTGQKELQYPVELGSTIGGRIVGELYVDYLQPTYQKNDFDRSDLSWNLTVEAICGTGPFLPKSRKAWGYKEENTAPLCVLANAYRRVDRGTRWLFVKNELSKQFAAKFRKNDPLYLDDTLWWEAAQEEDRKNSEGSNRESTPVNTGAVPSDDINSYLGITGGNTPDENNGATGSTVTKGNSSPTVEIDPSKIEADIDGLINRSTQSRQLSSIPYRYGNIAPMSVKVYALNKGEIRDFGKRKPCIFKSDGIDCTFIYDPKNELFAQYPFTPQMILAIYLSEKFKARDDCKDIMDVFCDLVRNTMSDSKIDKASLQERANSFFMNLREKMSVCLHEVPVDVIRCIHESNGEVEETVNNLIQAGLNEVLEAFQDNTPEGFDAIEHVPNKTLYRLIDRFPSLIFDGKILDVPFNTIKLIDQKACERTRDESKERILAYVKDALRAATGFGGKVQKDELTRVSISVDCLNKVLV